MPQDLLAQYGSIRDALHQEKSQLEQRLQAINGVLSESLAPVMAPRSLQRTSGGQSSTPGKRRVSPEARARMAAAQKARWARAGKGQGNSDAEAGAAAAKPKRQMSAAGRKRIAEAAKRRWAAAKAAGRSSL